MSKFGKLSVSLPKIWPKNLVREASFRPKSSSASSIVVKKLVQQVPKFGADPFYKPPYSALRSAHPIKIRVGTPLGRLYTTPRV